MPTWGVKLGEASERNKCNAEQNGVSAPEVHTQWVKELNVPKDYLQLQEMGGEQDLTLVLTRVMEPVSNGHSRIA